VQGRQAGDVVWAVQRQAGRLADVRGEVEEVDAITGICVFGVTNPLHARAFAIDREQLEIALPNRPLKATVPMQFIVPRAVRATQ
jgi:hypothetical protein